MKFWIAHTRHKGAILYSSEAEAYAEADDEGDGGRDEEAGRPVEAEAGAEAEAVRGQQPNQDGESQELDGAEGGQAASIYGSSYSFVSWIFILSFA